MKVASIGFNRDDGDFAILATLNNNDLHISDEQFAKVVTVITDMVQLFLPDQQIIALHRQDAPDYVDV